MPRTQPGPGPVDPQRVIPARGAQWQSDVHEFRMSSPTRSYPVLASMHLGIRRSRVSGETLAGTSIGRCLTRSSSQTGGTMIQLLAHLEGDALNVALLVPEIQRGTRSGLVGALNDHYGSPGRLADYRRNFERAV